MLNVNEVLVNSFWWQIKSLEIQFGVEFAKCCERQLNEIYLEG